MRAVSAVTGAEASVSHQGVPEEAVPRATDLQENSPQVPITQAPTTRSVRTSVTAAGTGFWGAHQCRRNIGTRGHNFMPGLCGRRRSRPCVPRPGVLMVPQGPQ